MWHVECCVAARRRLRKRRRWRTVSWLFLQGVIQKEADREKSLCCQKADGEPLFRVVISALFTIWQVSPPSPHLLPPSRLSLSDKFALGGLIDVSAFAHKSLTSPCARDELGLTPSWCVARRQWGRALRSITVEKWDFRGQNENSKRPRYVTPLSVWMWFPWQQKCSTCHGWALLSRWRKLWKEAVSTRLSSLKTEQRAGFNRTMTDEGSQPV